jgi:hypothetical protein
MMNTSRLVSIVGVGLAILGFSALSGAREDHRVTVPYSEPPWNYSSFNCNTDPASPDLGKCLGIGTGSSTFTGEWEGTLPAQIVIECTGSGASCAWIVTEAGAIRVRRGGCGGNVSVTKTASGTSIRQADGTYANTGSWLASGSSLNRKPFVASGILKATTAVDGNVSGDLNGIQICD